MNDSIISSPKKLVYNTDEDIQIDIKSENSAVSNRISNYNTKNLERLNSSKIEKIINYESDIKYSILDEDLALIDLNLNINVESIIENEANYINIDKDFDENSIYNEKKITYNFIYDFKEIDEEIEQIRIKKTKKLKKKLMNIIKFKDSTENINKNTYNYQIHDYLSDYSKSSNTSQRNSIDDNYCVTEPIWTNESRVKAIELINKEIEGYEKTDDYM